MAVNSNSNLRLDKELELKPKHISVDVLGTLSTEVQSPEILSEMMSNKRLQGRILKKVTTHYGFKSLSKFDDHRQKKLFIWLSQQNLETLAPILGRAWISNTLGHWAVSGQIALKFPELMGSELLHALRFRKLATREKLLDVEPEEIGLACLCAWVAELPDEIEDRLRFILKLPKQKKAISDMVKLSASVLIDLHEMDLK